MGGIHEKMDFDKELDARGLSCPMPLVKARMELNALAAGQVLKVVATDKGSVADFKGWSDAAAAVELVAQETEAEGENTVFVHYLRKVS